MCCAFWQGAAAKSASARASNAKVKAKAKAKAKAKTDRDLLHAAFVAHQRVIKQICILHDGTQAAWHTAVWHQAHTHAACTTLAQHLLCLRVINVVERPPMET